MTLLFIEDEVYTRIGVVESVRWEALGITRLETASDGKAGLEKLALRPDIVLTDIRMPYHTGLEIAAQAKKNDPDCEIVILSSHSDKEYLFKAISLSTVAYIEKPVDVEELSQALSQAVQRRRQSLRLKKMDGLERPSCETLRQLLGKAVSVSHPTRMMIEHLADHYADPALSVESIAARVHLNPVYASSVFKEETGHGLKRAIMEIRLQEACALLLTTNSPVADIAAKVGYRGANYFTKMFHKEAGLSPNEYRAAKEKQV